MSNISIRDFWIYRNLIFGCLLSLSVVLVALLSYVWTPFDVTQIDIANKLKTPNQIYWLGTDHFGRDILSMIMVIIKNI